jgi:hypothetical protein
MFNVLIFALDWKKNDIKGCTKLRNEIETQRTKRKFVIPVI